MHKIKIITEKIPVFYGKYQFSPKEINDFRCKFCGEFLRLKKRKQRMEYKIYSCLCQRKRGNKPYMQSVFGINTEEFNKNWHEYEKNRLCPGSYKQRLIKKYGEEKGKLEIEKWLKSCSVKREAFIERNGKEIGEKKYKEFLEKSNVSKNALIKKYGEEIGLQKHNRRCKKMKGKSYFSKSPENQCKNLEYYIRKFGEEIGLEKYLERNKKISEANSKENFISRHSEEEWKIVSKKRSPCLQSYIDRYGEEIGRIKHKEFCKNVTLNLEKFIKKYGQEIGQKKYDQYREKVKAHLIKDLPKMLVRRSKIANELFRRIIDATKIDGAKYDLNEFYIYDRKINKIFFYDFKYKNKIIEFNGVFWHSHPKFYKPDELHAYYKVKNRDIWKKDATKASLARSLGYDVLFVWEHIYKENREKILEKCISFLIGGKNDRII